MKKSINTYYCRCCGGTNIQVMAWVDANTNEYCSDVNTPCEEEDTWCDDCEEHTGILTLKELWGLFAEVPVNNEDEIEEPFLNFDVGTPKQDVWHWFDERCPNNLHDDLMFPYSFIEIGKRVYWNDPAINDYDESDREDVKNIIYVIDAIKYTNGVLDDDSIICISSESGTEAEVFPHELKPVL